MNLDNANELIKINDSKNSTLCISQQMRFQNHWLNIINIINKGLIGNIEYISYHNSKNRNKILNLKNISNPVLWEMSCHHFDNILSILGNINKFSVFCNAFKPSWSIYTDNCMVNALIVMNDNIHINYHAGYSGKSSNYSIRIEGTKGVLRYNGIHMSKNTGILSLSINNSKFKRFYSKDVIQKNEPWSIFLDKWYLHIINGNDFPFTANNNLKLLKMIDACILSNNKKKSVIIDL